MFRQKTNNIMKLFIIYLWFLLLFYFYVYLLNIMSYIIKIFFYLFIIYFCFNFHFFCFGCVLFFVLTYLINNYLFIYVIINNYEQYKQMQSLLFYFAYTHTFNFNWIHNSFDRFVGFERPLGALSSLSDFAR